VDIKKASVVIFAMVSCWIAYGCFLYSGLTTERVNGYSMMPTIKDGTRVRVDYDDNSYDRYDLVAFNFKTRDESFIKRVVAVGGDSVVFTDGGEILVNKERSDRSFLANREFEMSSGLRLLLKQLDYYEGVVPDGYFLLLGDNRERSYDSTEYGLVHVSSLNGVAYLGLFDYLWR
jgi:signal peptidase I